MPGSGDPRDHQPWGPAGAQASGPYGDTYYGQAGQSGQYGGPGQYSPPGPYGPPNQYGPPGQYAPPPAQPPGYPPPGYSPQGEYDPSQPYAQHPYPPGQPPVQPYSGQPYGPGQPLTPSDEQLWSTLSQISIPFIGLVGPLVVYLLFKDRGPFVRASAIESLNFSILYTIVQIVCAILTVVVIGAVLLPIVGIGALVLCILAAIAANKGEFYRYPVNWRLIK